MRTNGVGFTSGGGSPIWDLINRGLDTAGNILTRRYGNPDVDPGTVIRNADGTSVIRQAPGYPVQTPIGGYGQSGGIGMGTILIAGLAVVAVVMIKNKG